MRKTFQRAALMVTAAVGGFSLASAEVSMLQSFNARAAAEQKLQSCGISPEKRDIGCEPFDAKWKLREASRESREAGAEGLLGLGCVMMVGASYMRRRELGLD